MKLIRLLSLFLFLAAIALPARAAIAIVNHAGTGSTGFVTSYNLTIPTPTSGHGMILIWLSSSTDASLASVTHGTDTFTKNASWNKGSNIAGDVWSIPSISTTGTTVSMNMASGGDNGLLVYLEVSGQATSSWFDKSDAPTGSGEVFGATSMSTASSGTLSQANELAIGIFDDFTSQSDTYTSTGGATTALDETGDGGGLHVQYIVTNSTSAVTETATASASITYIAGVCTFKAAASSATQPKIAEAGAGHEAS